MVVHTIVHTLWTMVWTPAAWKGMTHATTDSKVADKLPEKGA